MQQNNFCDLRLIDTHEFDFISGYTQVVARDTNGQLYKVYYNGERVVFKDEKTQLIQYSLFEELNKILTFEWFEPLVDVLENEYYLMQSGSKKLSIYFKRLLNLYSDDIKYNNGYLFVPQKVYVHLANTIASRYKHKWNEIYKVMYATYNPLENFNINENTSESKEEKNITDKNSTKTGNDSRDINNNDFNFGFNSIDPNQTGKSTSSDLINYNSIVNNKDTITITKDPNKNIITRERSGNIGVKTTQSLIQEEIELRKYNFINTIMTDIDNILTASIY